MLLKDTGQQVHIQDMYLKIQGVCFYFQQEQYTQMKLY